MDFESARTHTHTHFYFLFFWILVYILKRCPLICQLTICCYYVSLSARISALSLLSQARVNLQNLYCFCRVFLSRLHSDSSAHIECPVVVWVTVIPSCTAQMVHRSMGCDEERPYVSWQRVDCYICSLAVTSPITLRNFLWLSHSLYLQLCSSLFLICVFPILW